MKLLDVNPFVRTALKIKVFPFFKNTISFDSRLFYIVDGNGIAYINDKPYPFIKGTLMLFQCGTKYRLESNSAITLKVINFDYTTDNCAQTNTINTVIDDGSSYNIKQIYFDDAQILNEPIVIKNASFLTDLINNINLTIAENQNLTNYTYEKRSIYFKNCLINIIENVSAENSGVDLNRFNVIIDYIKNNYNQDIKNVDLAKLIGYHPYYLNRLFNQYYGVTLHQYLINFRLNKAEYLLISTDKQIIDVAYETGFSSSISLTINFKNKYGITPTEFRKNYRNFY